MPRNRLSRGKVAMLAEIVAVLPPRVSVTSGGRTQSSRHGLCGRGSKK